MATAAMLARPVEQQPKPFDRKQLYWMLFFMSGAAIPLMFTLARKDGGKPAIEKITDEPSASVSSWSTPLPASASGSASASAAATPSVSASAP